MHRRRAVIGGLAALAVAALVAAASWYDRPPATASAWLAEAGLEPRFATIGSQRVRFVRAGAGSAVVLIHGFGSSIYTWKDVIPALAARHDVTALDLPGFGRSDQPDDLAFGDLPRAVLGLMQALGVERAALVGNSLGGAVAAVAASSHPERVAGLVLVDAAGFQASPSDQPGMVRLATSWAAPLVGRLPGKRLLVEASLRQVFFDPRLVTPERVEEYLAPLRRPQALRAMRSLGKSFAAGPMLAPALAGIEAPTLVLWGDADRWIPLAHADRFVAAIPGAKKRVIPACGHMPQEERPAELARLLLEFLG